MTYAWKEREDLARADRDIAAGEKRIADQILVIQGLITSGRDTTEAETRLHTYRQTLQGQRRLRDLILDEIARLEAPRSQRAPTGSSS